MKSIASTISRWGISAGAPRRPGGPAARRVEQVGDQLLLPIGQRDNEARAYPVASAHHKM